ncbi:hypothetical protein Tcan_16047 [Toxocara canis]|uniref:Uncharacterized protein n=1 Tax=Toxocara canis TaxID=6265 RepID=A0A0B2VP37_TOXCA|nr:hypothetical protein Tcan_16047 [Toxocara canis]
MGASSSSSSRSANFSSRSSTSQRSFRNVKQLNVSNSSLPVQIKHRERQLVAEGGARSTLNRQRSNVNRNAKEFSKFWTRGGSLQPQRQSQRRCGSKRRTHERSLSPFLPNVQDKHRTHPYGWESFPCSPSLAATSRGGCERLQGGQCSRCSRYTTADGTACFCDRQSTSDHTRSISHNTWRRRPSLDPPFLNQIPATVGQPNRIEWPSQGPPFPSQIPSTSWQPSRSRRTSHDSSFLNQIPSGGCQPQRMHRSSQDPSFSNHIPTASCTGPNQQLYPTRQSVTRFYSSNQLLVNRQQPIENACSLSPRGSYSFRHKVI